jgi:hypothetical protein
LDQEIAPYFETDPPDLAELLLQERDALRRADVKTLLALADQKLSALRAPLDPSRLERFRALAAENHDLLAHLLESLRSVLIAAVTPDGALYGPSGQTPAEPRPLQRRYG